MPSGERLGSPSPGAIRVEGDERQDLIAGWWVASCRPDACAAPAETDGLDWLPATVPGTAAGALRDAGAWDFDDGRDFDASDWWFRTKFEAAPAAGEEVVLLRLDGVATVHEVWLNGERIGAGESMFAAAAIDVGAILREGANELAIRCLALGPRLGTRRKPRARWRARLADNRLRFFRTMLLGRCPGFAPGPAAVGPWRPVWLERRRGLTLVGIELRPRCEGEDGVLAVRLRGRMPEGATVESAEASVAGPGAASAPLEVVAEDDGRFALRGELRVEGAERWWPHTHGDPVLYEVALKIATAAGAVGIDAGRIGFRELAAGPGPDHDVLVDGLDLHLNGVAVFARGAVWTPDDFVGMAPDRDRLRRALERVRDAGMNIVRLQGTGAYESPDFHDLCDELGILVWQDFAFANFDYPVADPDFRAAVEVEAAEVLAALAARPSLVVLCGNSEVEQQVAMLGLDPALGREELFGELLPAAVERSGVDAVWLPSAPCGGAFPFRFDQGVSNYFGVGGYRRPLTDTRLAAVRFASECLAFGNVPGEIATRVIEPDAPVVVVHDPRWKAGTPRDAGEGWDFDDVRDHYLRDLLGVDGDSLRAYDPARYLELSRAVSAEVMSAVFGEWRRGGSPCRGGIVLWLRDLRPGAGWGLVDHAGTPKPVLETLRRTLDPTAVWLTDEGLGGVGVHVAQDRPEGLAASLRVALYADRERQVGEATEELRLDPHTTVSRDLEAMLGGFVDASWAYRFGPPQQNLVVASLELPGGDAAEPLSQAVLFPAGRPTAAESREELGLEASARRDGDGVVVELGARRFVWNLGLWADGLDAGGGALTIEPGRRRRVRLRADGAATTVTSVSLTAVNLAGRVTIAVDD